MPMLMYDVVPLVFGTILLIFGGKNLACCGPCTGTEFAGPSNISDANVFIPDVNDSNTTTLFANNLYTIPCCGLLSSWEVVAEGAGKVRLQVWRRVPGTTNQFTFIGQNGWEKTTPAIRYVTRTIPAVSQVPVDEGDFLAIYHFGDAIVRYNTCDPVSSPSSDCSESVYYANDIPGSEISEGFQYTYSSLQSAILGVSTIRNYAIKPYFSTKSPATCQNETITISDTLVTGSHVINVTASNVDLSSSTSIFSIESTEPVIPITINSQTGEITTTDILTPSYPSSTYVITVRVVDVCSQSNTCILTLTVNSDAQPVNIENLPTVVQVLHVPDYTLTVYTVQISRQRDIDDVACVIQSASPELNDVQIEIRNNSKTEFSVLMVTSPSYTETDIDSVFVTVFCLNNQGFNNQSTLTLEFKPGTPNENRFWIIGLLLAFIVVVTIVIVLIIIYTACSQSELRRQFSSASNPRRSRQTKPNVVPAPIFIEPARTTFSSINSQSRQQHTGRLNQVSPETVDTGYETSPISSIGSDVTPTSITSIGFVESPDEGESRLLTSAVNRKKNSVFIFNSKPDALKKFYFRKKPWIP